MTQSKHTKGPWEVGYKGWKGEYIGTLNRVVCQVATSSNPYEDQANARLIEAAPGLLDALMQAVRDYDDNKPQVYGEEDGDIWHDPEWVNLARAVIAKATTTK